MVFNKSSNLHFGCVSQVDEIQKQTNKKINKVKHVKNI